MAYVLKTAPAIEPLTLSEVKLHLRLDSGTLADNITTEQSIAPGAYTAAASYGIAGTGVDVLGYRALVNLNSGANSAGGTLDGKIQESDDNATYTDWTGGSFTQVTTSNDTAIFEKAYTGTKQYIKAVATVAGVVCKFAVDIIKEQPYSAEDSLLSALIVAAREYCEAFQNRAYIPQTWEYWMDDFPCGDEIRIPYPPLQSVTGVYYYDTDNTSATMTASDYFVDSKSQPGRVVLAYSKTWPTTTLRPANGVYVEFVAGYGDDASDVPQMVRNAMLLLIGYWHENREAALSGNLSKEIEFSVRAILGLRRVRPA
jgi:uncharacterized phiE125 gp8 family phage protein